MRWPFERKTSPPESFAVGPYKLDGSIEGLGGLIEFSPTEYAALGRRFVGERDYDALPVDFLGHPWEVMVQAVNGRISAIASYLLIGAGKTRTGPQSRSFSIAWTRSASRRNGRRNPSYGARATAP